MELLTPSKTHYQVFEFFLSIRRTRHLNLNAVSICSHFTQNKPRTQYYPIFTLNPVKAYLKYVSKYQLPEFTSLFFSRLRQILSQSCPFSVHKRLAHSPLLNQIGFLGVLMTINKWLRKLSPSRQSSAVRVFCCSIPAPLGFLKLGGLA